MLETQHLRERLPSVEAAAKELKSPANVILFLRREIDDQPVRCHDGILLCGGGGGGGGGGGLLQNEASIPSSKML